MTRVPFAGMPAAMRQILQRILIIGANHRHDDNPRLGTKWLAFAEKWRSAPGGLSTEAASRAWKT